MRKRRYKRKNRLLIITSVLLVICILVSISYCRMRPVILRFAESVAETILLDSANEAIIDVLSDNNISYKDIVSLSNNEQGYVTSLETDIKKINYLKSCISNRLSKIIAKKEFYEVEIPLGTFFNNEYTSGLGPKITFHMQLTSTPVIDFEHEFKSTGINDVLHLVKINLDINGSLIITGYSDKISVSTSAIAAQTVIVGVVPDAITNIVETTEDDTAGLINDYGAGDFNLN